MVDDKKLRDRLAAAKAQDEAILQSIGDGLVVADAEGNFIFFNEPAQRILGIGAVKSGAKSWSEVYGVYYSDDLKTKVETDNVPLVRAIHGETFDKMDIFIKNPELPHGVYITVTGRPMRDQNGKILGGVIVFRDTTHDKEIDKAKTEFVSLASHQLRTPLSAINWYTEMLLNGDAGAISPDQKQYLNEVAHANQRMVELVNSLLNVSRIDLGTFAVEPEITNVIEIAQSVAKELVPQITQKRLVIKEFYDPNTPTLKADPKLLRIIFQNLLSNAVKYTPEKGTVSVSIALELQEVVAFFLKF
jgi:PAS domain S-box-containing protein